MLNLKKWPDQYNKASKRIELRSVSAFKGRKIESAQNVLSFTDDSSCLVFFSLTAISFHLTPVMLHVHCALAKQSKKDKWSN